ncbi:class I SAM-dependent methyltransferase [Paraconexibacter algicola]|uniref:Class I SAM-dependent methyltransferase n=1 Tax=Paraconexibacter algicola TaxID=2133960 RepID=A0A2T4UCA9_9ACTN|nr:class I SAM-dependent methyltransferase [Paraconexibacter algicola]PTL54854.1 hypothetical protein C7Y72_19920 [Paraconexibacter algicola]
MVPGPGGGFDVLAAAYENDRPEVRALVPPRPRRVLDVGCSSGALGAALKADGAGTVVGLERDPAYVAIARERLDAVHAVDLDADVPLPEEPFDVIVCADVLEHLRDPEAVLARLVRALAPGGTVVVSLPNVRHWETFWQLGVRGTFPRRSMGIFDRTHLRWFTLADAYGLCAAAGLEVVEVRRVLRPRPTGPSDGRLVRLLARGPGRTFLTFQHVLAARRVGDAPAS